MQAVDFYSPLRRREINQSRIMPMRHLNAIVTLLMMFFTPLILSFIGILEFPSASTSLPYPDSSSDDAVSSDPFRDVLVAFIKWDLEVGCARFRENHHKGSIRGNVSSGSLQESGSLGCGGMKMDDVRCAASMNVGVGSFSDPEGMDGLAQFLDEKNPSDSHILQSLRGHKTYRYLRVK
ncbi:hypothetical protein Bca52824_023154 [Brassica carinata]|uniref:Uncharacterized protein n=1 Tax=Brassica carinata TaxID=52824 RepID=A0A8X7VI20_BRACI|nr:hypothetical protein Bca52824_023154 [Brassica carinata]